MSESPEEIRARFRRVATNESTDRLGKVHRGDGSEPRSAEPSASPSPSRERRGDGLAVRAALQERLLDELTDRDLLAASEAEIAAFVREFAARALEEEDLPLNSKERERLADELTEEAIGVGPLAPLMADPAITDILVNGPHQVFVERFGRIETTAVRFRDADHLSRVIERLAARVGRRIDQSWPMVDFRLRDGSRVNATLPPATIDWPTLSIRRFGRRRLRRSELAALGMLSDDMAAFLDVVVKARLNVLISGGTGAGKSTLLGALCEAIPGDERVITIEDTAELVLDQRHWVRMETRPANVEGRGVITARDLLVNALRMRPTRIIVGEVRGGEALDMLQAMNTGHEGGLSTVHANSPRDALARLETMSLMAGVELPQRAIREQIVAAIDLLVHLERGEDGIRRVVSVAEVAGSEGDVPLLQEIFRFQRRGRAREARERIDGEFVATGIVPRAMDRIRERGFELPNRAFQRLRPQPGPDDST
jgi:pilus assembly protein CpaF